MSLINKSTKAWNIYLGIPAKRLTLRNKNILKLEKEFEKELKKGENE